MADVKLNALVDGVSGKVGKNIVLRQRGGRTFLGTRPAQTELSEKQKVQRERFLAGVRFAKSILLSPEAKVEYEAIAETDEFLTPYSAAVKDFLVSPVIDMIDTEAFTGKQGEKIFIRIADNFKVLNMKVQILAADGSVLESGEAMSTHPARLDWAYVAQQNYASLAGCKIVATAQDRPGKETTLEKLF